VSTASLDKNPQSQEKGITNDLGFTAFFVKFPEKKFPKLAQMYKYI
jgi:selenocysteine-specific elongation factor